MSNVGVYFSDFFDIDEDIIESYGAVNISLIRPCLKIGGMPDWGRFFCQARRFDAGILTDFKSNQRSPGGKRCPKTAFCHFSNKA